ncbi:MAG: ABC transporter ATP-binding protein, partial [Acidobacteriota bacterium]
MSSLLTVRELCKGYRSGDRRLEVLVNLSLAVERGELVGITGVSGSGKSTLLHLLGGMDRPERGSITIQGEEITGMSAEQLSGFRNRTVGFVFQFHHLLPEFTALENVMMPLLLRGEPRAAAAGRAAEMLEGVGLGPRRDHRPGELSGGEQQRVAMARALTGRPDLLLADEPTGNLDPQTTEEIGRLLLRLHAEHHLTSLLVTHNEQLTRICSTTYRLEDGGLR